MTTLARLQCATAAWKSSVRRLGGVFLRDVGHGLLEVSHNTLALVGLVAVAVAALCRRPRRPAPALESAGAGLAAGAPRGARRAGRRLAAVELAEPDAVARATAADPGELTEQQAAVATGSRAATAWRPSRSAGWCRKPGRGRARRPRPDPDPGHHGGRVELQSVCAELGRRAGPDAGMTRVHDDKYEAFGGNHAAFDPVTNLRVGVQVLKECIARAGSLEAACATTSARPTCRRRRLCGKVLAEQSNLRQVAGRQAPCRCHRPTRRWPQPPATTPATATSAPRRPDADARRAGRAGAGPSRSRCLR